MRLDGTEHRRGYAVAALLVAMTVLGTVLRFWRLGDWNFQATEMFTLRDSLHPRLTNPRPLIYLLNYYLVRPLMPLDELGLRLLPALFGALTIPTFYLVSRRLLGIRAALCGTFLLTIGPLHVLYSQLARYWSLVFLLCAIYPYAIYLGLRDRNPRAITLGVVIGIVAVLAHPVSVVLVGGLAVWMVAGYLRRISLRELWGRRGVRWAVAITAVVTVVIAWRFVPMLQSWISAHDRSTGKGQFLSIPTVGRGVKQIVFLLNIVDSLTLPLTLFAGLGFYVLWRERDRLLALLLVCLAVVPVAFITLVSLRTAVSTYYVLPALPAFFLGAGVFVDRLFAADWGLRPRWLVPAAALLIAAAAGAPTLISDTRDGRRFDFRGAARWLTDRLKPGDAVFSDQPMVLAYYLPQVEVQKLRQDPVPLSESLRALNAEGRGGVIWIVAPAPSHAFRTDLKAGGLIDWTYDHCQLRNLMGVGRVDVRQQYLQVYRCPPAPAGGVRVPAAASRSQVNDGASATQDGSADVSSGPLRANTSR